MPRLRKMDRFEYGELIKERIQSSEYSHKELLEKLGLTKYAFSKIIHNKQKMYLDDFIDLAYALNLIHPEAKLSFLDAYLNRASVHRYEHLLNNRYWNTWLFYQAALNLNNAEIDTGHFQEMAYDKAYKNLYAIKPLLEDNRASEDDTSTVNTGEIIKLLTDIYCELQSHSSQFDEASYLEYLHLKKNAELIENQYVFNLSEITQE